MRRLIQPSFLLSLLLMVVAEIVLRCTLSPMSVATFQYGYHPDSGFQEAGDGMVHLVPAPTRDFHAQIFSRERPPGVFRIFTLGNSVEYWDAVASQILSNTYPARLGEELRRRGINAESINLAVSGYGTRRNEVLLRKALTYQPRLIILKLDTANEGADEICAQRARVFNSLRPQEWVWKSYLIQTGLRVKEHWLLERTLPLPILAWTYYDRPVKKDTAKSTIALPFNEPSRHAIEECLQLAREHDVPILLITQAYVTHDGAGRAEVTDRGLDDFAATRCGPGVTMVSLKQLLGRLPLEENFSDHLHLTHHGHQLVARAVADAVQDMAQAQSSR
jgi:hypothetical protein